MRLTSLFSFRLDVWGPLLAVASVALTGCGGDSPSPAGSMVSGSDNPLLAEWHTEYGVPPFDLIQNEHYVPAFREAMAQHKADLNCVMIGIGAGIYYGQAAVGTLVGLGVGFILFGIIKAAMKR